MTTERVKPAGVAGVVYPAGSYVARESSDPFRTGELTASASVLTPAGIQVVAKGKKEIPKKYREILKNTVWLTEGDEILNFHNGDGTTTHLVLRADGTVFVGEKAGLSKPFSEAKARLATKSGRVGIVLDEKGRIKTIILGMKHRGEKKPQEK